MNLNKIISEWHSLWKVSTIEKERPTHATSSTSLESGMKLAASRVSRTFPCMNVQIKTMLSSMKLISVLRKSTMRFKRIKIMASIA